MEGEKQILNFGKSILVPSVQELVKGSSSLETTIPHRYVQQYQDPAYCDPVDGDLQVPIINMETLMIEDKTELQKLHSACQDWGFFQIINHGIDKSLIERFKSETREFFNLPIEEKKKYWQTPTEVEGFGQAFVTSDDQKLDWADIFFLTTFPTYLRKPNLLPKIPLPYRETLELYSGEVKNVAMKLIGFMSRALGIESEILESKFDKGIQSLRINYYPPCPQPEKVIGLTPHSDSVGLTILVQFDDQVEGLQISKQGKWILVKPYPDALVVNIGDIMEMMTNGTYRSILHRAVVNATKERISVAAFHSPNADEEIGPLPDLLKQGDQAKFIRISAADFLRGLFTRPLDGKSYLDHMRINGNE